MKKIRTIPTIIGIILLVLGVGTGGFLVQKASNLLVRANPEIIPKQVKITNVTDTTFTVSWITDSQTTGSLNYGTDKNPSFLAGDDRDQLSGKTGSFTTHHVTLKNLNPTTTYFFKIISGEKVFDNNGEPYQVATGPQIKTEPPPNDIAYGIVLNQNGSPAEGVIVYLSLPNSFPLSVLTKSSGSWVIPLNLARSRDLSSYLSYDREATIEEIFIQGGSTGTAIAITLTKNDSPVPSITLGGSFDFREGQPEIMITPPVAEESKFSFENISSSAAEEKQLTILNPSLDEKISTQTPQIIGTGPRGQTITIKIESPTPISGQTTIDNDGNWQWVPPISLSPGEHTLTVSLPDGTKIIRRFTVLANEEIPSFTASPSATLTPTSTPIPSPTTLLTLTPTPTSTPTATPTIAPQVSQPGNSFPTLIILVISSVMLLFGLFANFLFKKN